MDEVADPAGANGDGNPRARFDDDPGCGEGSVGRGRDVVEDRLVEVESDPVERHAAARGHGSQCASPCTSSGPQ